MKISAIINGSSNRANRTKSELLNLGNIQVLVTKKAEDTNTFAKQVLEENADLVLVAGGDGTVNQVINTWLALHSKNLPMLALIPIGSANDFARTIGFKNVKTILKNASEGLTIPTDILSLNANGIQRYCLNLTNVGIGANIAKTVAKRRRSWPSKLNYFSATVTWLTLYKAPKVELMVDDYKLSLTTFLTAIGNAKFSGDGLCLCPQASINDGKMAVTIIGKVGLKDFIRYLPKLRLGQEIKDPRILYKKAAKFRIRVLEGKLAIETDGEFAATLTNNQVALISVLPASLQIVKPI
ncbi:MAG: YegS/Rv2252/BmrU family lipid kinase [Salibacteraceae bacterium]|nr:YegS/Rv2252/BmrU family lipid kinase [Salibacteraceae bacterium]